MAERIWSSPRLFVSFGGDENAGRQHLRKARSLVGYLFDQLRPGQTHRFQTWNFRDGLRITVRVWRDVLEERAHCEIYVPVREDIPEIVFPKSGLFEARNTDPQLDGFLRDVVFVKQIDKGTWKRTDWEQTQEVFHSLVENSMPCGSVSGVWGTKPKRAYAGCYTGEMRKVGQLLLGSNVPVLYSYCAKKTHGIYTASNGAKWVIEISDDDGVTAWKLPVDISRSPVPGMSYYPASITALPPLIDRKQLLPAIEFAGWVDKYPWYEECGWAFNSSGSSAVNTCYTFVTRETSLGPEPWYRIGYLYRIDISEGINQEPAEATLTLIEQGNLFTISHSLFDMKFPRFAGVSGAAIQSVYLSYPNSGNRPEDYESAPVYAFYKDNSLVVVRHRVAPYEIEQYNDVPSGALGCYTGVGLGYPKSLGSGLCAKGQKQWAEKVWFEVEGMTNPLPGYTNEDRLFGWDWTLNWEESPLSGWISATDANGTPVIAENHVRVDYQLTRTDWAAMSSQETFIVPFFDRESFYIFRRQGIKQPIKNQYTLTNWNTYAKGTIYKRNMYSNAFCTYPLPCLCGGTALLQYIGLWSEGTSPIGVIPDDNPSSTIGGVNGVRVKAPSIAHKPDRLIFCYNPDGDPAATGVCSSRETVSYGNISEPELGRYVGLFFSSHHGVTTLFDRQLTISDLDDLSYEPIFDFSGEDFDKAIWLDASLDVFSGAGSVSAQAAGLAANQRHEFKSAGSYYPLDTMNLRQRGWFGVPFPEYLTE